MRVTRPDVGCMSGWVVCSGRPLLASLMLMDNQVQLAMQLTHLSFDYKKCLLIFFNEWKFIPKEWRRHLYLHPKTFKEKILSLESSGTIFINPDYIFRTPNQQKICQALRSYNWILMELSGIIHSEILILEVRL